MPKIDETDNRWVPPAGEVRARLETMAGRLGAAGLLPPAALALILPTLRAKIRGLSDADAVGLLLYLEQLVDELWYGPALQEGAVS